MWVFEQAEQPVLAVTGENNRPELSWVLTQWGIVLFVYFLVVPVSSFLSKLVKFVLIIYLIRATKLRELQPVIMVWLWKRWYRRGLLEMYLQFMFVFIFFPGSATLPLKPNYIHYYLVACISLFKFFLVTHFRAKSCRVILWAPFLNFRKFPRDPSMQYPWSVPEDPSKIRSSYGKYPYAPPEDYDNL